MRTSCSYLKPVPEIREREMIAFYGKLYGYQYIFPASSTVSHYMQSVQGVLRCDLLFIFYVVLNRDIIKSIS